MDNVGLKRGYLELMDYREDYKSIYEKEKEELVKIYKDKIYKIDHVGSTSIKNIKSKPIIDILIQTNDLEDFKAYTEENALSTYTFEFEAPTDVLVFLFQHRGFIQSMKLYFE